MIKVKKIRILLAAERKDGSIEWKDEFYQWLSELLKRDFVLEEIYIRSDPNNSPSFLKRLALTVKKWNRLKKEFCPDKIIIYGKAMTTIWTMIFFVRLFGLKNEIIVFRYDIENFRPYWNGLATRFGHFIARKLEKYSLINADKIIHKGLENELSFLPFHHKIRNKPHYLFREFINTKRMKKYDPRAKLSNKDGEIHLVTVGTISLENVPGACTLWEFYPQITNQKIHLHIYMKADAQTEAKLRDIEIHNRYLHFHGYLDPRYIVNEISKYDYGIYMTSSTRKNEDKNIVISAVGYRIFEYIAAHLPLICTLDNPAHVDIVKKYGIGVYIRRSEIKRLKEILKNENYSCMVKNIDKAIKDFSDPSNFIKFIKS